VLGLDYLKNDRHLTDDTIKTFNLGFCEADGTIYTNYDLSSLALDSRFFGTALFPIFDLYDQLIGVSARKIQRKSNMDLKYINTVYSKTQHLFGLNVTWQECLKTRKVYVVEGNVDVMMCYQQGIKNVVGMLGSTLKLTQLCLLARFVDEIVFVPDGDDAGRKFLARMLDKDILKHDLEVKFSTVVLPEGYDPDKFLYEKRKNLFLGLENSLFLSLEQRLSDLGSNK